MDRAAEEQRSTFYTADAAELCMSYVRSKSFKKNWYVLYEYEFYSSKNILGTTFPNFGD